MSWTKNGRTFCDKCGKFCVPFDEETPFGCANPEAPEPYDPYHYCKPCSKILYKEYLVEFQIGRAVNGMWAKSKAETRAAKKFKLVWLHSGIGMLGTKIWADAYQYISQEKYDRLKVLPYWGYCNLCFSENANGYCSNQKCDKDFINRTYKTV